MQVIETAKSYLKVDTHSDNPRQTDNDYMVDVSQNHLFVIDKRENIMIILLEHNMAG